MAELDRRLGEAIKVGIDTGRIDPVELDERQTDVLRLAGWEVTSDGRVVPAGTADAGTGEPVDATEVDEGGTDGAEDDEAGEAPAEQRPKGCGGCAAAGGPSGQLVAGLAALGAWLAFGLRRGRRRPR